jgi:membrane protease YdiL (CAAX protease family)
MSTNRSEGTLETRRIGGFLLVAFLVSWSVGAVVVFLTRFGTVPTVGSIPVTLPLIGVGFMFGPAVAHVVVRTATGEGWIVGEDDVEATDGNVLERFRAYLPLRETYLRPRILEGWPYWIAAWLLPAVLTVLGAGLYFLVFPDQFGWLEPMRQSLAEAEAQTGQPMPFSAEMLLAITVVSALTIAIPINAVGAFGEEFGWRAYLLPKLLPLGPRRAVLVLGVIWGVWHWPLIAIGHNYGLEYPYAPFPGMLAMLWFTTVVGIVLAWLTLRGGSVWPAVIAHAGLNAIAGIGVRVASGDPNLLLGPTPAGLIGSLPFAVLATWILLDEDRLRPSGEAFVDDDDPGESSPAATVEAPGTAGSAAAVSDDAGDG